MDIAIAGAGIAGLACAALLRRAGHRVTLYDQAAAPAPVGSGLILQPIGLHVLGLLGLRDDVEAKGARIARLYGKSNDAIVLDVRYAALGADVYGVAVHRATLFGVLYDEALRTGASLELGRVVSSVDDGVVRFADGRQSARFDLVIDALGVRSVLSRRSPDLTYGALWANVAQRPGFAPDALEQRYEAARKMAGVLPIGPGTPGTGQAAYFWSLRGRDYAAWRTAPLDAWKDQARALWPQTAPLLDQLRTHDDLVFARYAHRTFARPVAHKIAHVGDSWHCTSPQLGQGANLALVDALALAMALTRQDDLALALAEYVRMRRAHVWLYQTASYLFTPAYQSDGAALPWVRDRIVGPLAKLWPAPQILASLVAGAVGWPLAAIGGDEQRLGASYAPGGSKKSS